MLQSVFSPLYWTSLAPASAHTTHNTLYFAALASKQPQENTVETAVARSEQPA